MVPANDDRVSLVEIAGQDVTDSIPIKDDEMLVFGDVVTYLGWDNEKSLANKIDLADEIRKGETQMSDRNVNRSAHYEPQL